MSNPPSRLKSWVTGVVATAFLTLTSHAADFTTQKWRAAEIPLTSAVTYADPFQNVDVTATFTGPGGEVIVRPAFWDGGNTWRVRFAPTVTGPWTMTTTCTDPSNNGLQGVSRTIQCDAYAGTLPIFQHGFIKPSADGHYFTYADGTPFFYLGDTHWLYTHERFSTSNIPGVPSQFKYTVDKRVAQGFTVFQTEAIQIPHGAGAHDDPSEEPHADLRDGLTEADLPGFANMDRKFAYLADSGMVHANSEVTWAAEPGLNAIYTQDYMTRLGRYWAARYAAYPVFWTVAQEIDPNLYGAYNTTTMGLWYAAAKAVTDNDAYGQPMGPHMESIGNGITHPSDSSWASKPYHKWWAMQIQYDRTAAVWESAAKEFYQNTPAKPVVLYESPYDTFWTDNKGARTSGYRAFQTGMYGYGYGANGTWNDLYTLGDYGTDYFMPGSYLQWFDGANLPTGGQMTHLKNFYTALNWWQLVPRYDDATWSAFADPDHSLVSSDGNSTYVTYFFGDGNATGTLKGMAVGAAYEASWYNPRTGAFTSLGGIIPTAAGEWTVPVRPTSDDWILLARQNPDALVTTPSNGVALPTSFSLSHLSWTASGSPAGLNYEVYFGTAALYDMAQPHGNLARLTPQGGIVTPSVALPTSLSPGTYYWLLTVTDPTAGTTRTYTSSFVFSGGTVPVDDGSFETPGALSGSNGWAHLNASWTTTANSEFQQNNLAPATSSHFTATPPGGGSWYALMNANIGTMTKDLHTPVNAGDTLSITLYGGRAQASSSTAAGGIFTATLMVGATPYSLQVDTTTQANDSWKSYTLTKTIANSGNLSLAFSAVSGSPWLDNIGSVTVNSTPVLFVKMAAPVDGGQIPTGAMASASATVTNATGPVTVSYDLTGPSGVTASLGSSTAVPGYAMSLGTLANGAYQIRATATDSSATATSLIQTFRVGPTTTLAVQDGSFETTGGLVAAEGWARLSPVWNPAVTSDYQQDSLVTLASAHLSAASPGPDGGVWYALLNGNTGSIHQDLQTTVHAGDSLSVTFYGGRAREVASTTAGGVFNASFVVGSTRYTMPVDTTVQANDRWQSFTLTKTITNTGNLSLEFSKVSGDPWLDQVSNVVVMPATPYGTWIASQPGVPAGQTGFSDDPNGDGIGNGLAWILGGSAMTTANDKLPVASISSGALRLHFSRLHDAGQAALYLEYGTTLNGWTPVQIPAGGGAPVPATDINVTVTPIGTTGYDAVDLEIPAGHAAAGKLFARLRAYEAAP